MKSLSEIQNDFQTYLFSENNLIAQQIVSTEKMSGALRLSIYKNAYLWRLQEALSATYPVLKQELGETLFMKITEEYIQTHPSSFRSIRWFGDQLTDFLKNHPETKHLPYLSELAELEWAMTLVFDAAESPLLCLDDMKAIPPEAWANMRLNLHPSVQLLYFSWNVFSRWQSHLSLSQSPEPHKTDSPTACLLWRKKSVNQFTCLPEEEAWAIQALLNKASFAEMCEGLCQWVSEEEAGLRAASLLKGWINAELISDVVTSNSGQKNKIR